MTLYRTLGCKMRKPWATAAWRKRREEILKTRNKCEWCGSTKILTMDHIAPRNSLTDERYRALIDEDIIVLCSRCAMARRKGMHLCPKCREKYALNRFTVCSKCYPIWKKERQKELEEIAKEDPEEVDPMLRILVPTS